MFPDYSRPERLADAAVHGLGVVAALAGTGALLAAVIPSGGARAAVGAAVYAAGLLATVGASAAYNLTAAPGPKEIIRRCDHAAVFLMIAGTYTPFALAAIGGAAGAVLLAVMWTLALVGAAGKLLRPRRFERASLLLYLALGWIGLAALGVLIEAAPGSAVALLLAGGALYTAGVVFHLWRSLPYHNALWHAFVLAGAGCHYVAVYAVLAGA
ncbi:MAG: hemolysin III family protein [Alphaproteobacteria bacterium]|nr:hemolysin III family protein [Alphaproteobacteria bacterium]